MEAAIGKLEVQYEESARTRNLHDELIFDSLSNLLSDATDNLNSALRFSALGQCISTFQNHQLACLMATSVKTEHRPQTGIWHDPSLSYNHRLSQLSRDVTSFHGCAMVIFNLADISPLRNPFEVT
ncbi:hypothetical protein ED733_001466 [Metarhizium rileyi]|uniref:Uncharacterized protein n=1 Tax=Metarhizium rileyi (strain RCEF 4871) TaxID=1649241 RepID=A0A5C6G7Y5_METRR|nr:hypothetical protein ED733_001466 [Metarhizium rileyi]